MTFSTAKPFIFSAIGLSMAMSFSAQADIQEISPEEMTETHIRDTTVIIRKQQEATEEPQQNINVTVTPNDGHQLDSIDDPNNRSQSRPDLTPLSDSYLAEQKERSLQQQQANVELAPYDASQIERERNLQKIWQEFDLQGDIPKDYGNLTFPTIDPSGNNIPAGTDFSVNPHEFSISIPNSGNYQPKSHQTPNGEYQIDITDDKIRFIMNLPNK